MQTQLNYKNNLDQKKKNFNYKKGIWLKIIYITSFA